MNRAAVASGKPVSGPLPIPTRYPCLPQPFWMGALCLRGHSPWGWELSPPLSVFPSLPPAEPALAPRGEGWDEECQHREGAGGAGRSRGPVLRSLLPHLAWPFSLSLNHWCLKRRKMKRRSWNPSWSWKRWGGILLPAVLRMSLFSHSLKNIGEVQRCVSLHSTFEEPRAKRADRTNSQWLMGHSPFLGGFLVELSCPLTSCNRFSSSRFFSKASSSFVFPTGFLIARKETNQD